MTSANCVSHKLAGAWEENFLVRLRAYQGEQCEVCVFWTFCRVRRHDRWVTWLGWMWEAPPPKRIPTEISTFFVIRWFCYLCILWLLRLDFVNKHLLAAWRLGMCVARIFWCRFWISLPCCWQGCWALDILPRFSRLVLLICIRV